MTWRAYVLPWSLDVVVEQAEGYPAVDGLAFYRTGDSEEQARSNLEETIRSLGTPCQECNGVGGTSGSIPYNVARWKTPCPACKGLGAQPVLRGLRSP